jgi:hypothetical protein
VITRRLYAQIAQQAVYSHFEQQQLKNAELSMSMKHSQK